ncbi:WD40 repeat domain-containing protein [Streptomyces sp. NPDC016309]|uniref:WD40 repeat domain-containing protein n=1 Tax=Streptomyces sp. NPDC016309 TaxID=3364965 RepID=UPI0036F9C2D0
MRVPLAGRSALGAAWAIADRLGVVARTPGELVQVLTAGIRRVVLVLPDLDAAHEPERVADLIEWLADLDGFHLVVGVGDGSPAHVRLCARPDAAPASWPERPPSPTPPPGARRPSEGGGVAGGFDPDDPGAVCAADPWRVTARYGAGDAGGDHHGGLRPAWLRAGQSLCREQAPSRRALVLLAALDDAADPRLRPALERLAALEPWRVRWTRARGDVSPPWPGPVTALAICAAPEPGRLLVAVRPGTVRALHTADGSPAGTPAHPGGRPATALACLPGGTLLLLDERGRLHVPRPDPLADAVAATLAAHPGTALAAAGGTVVVGDRVGSLHAFGLTGVHQAAAHSGRVTAVAAVASPGPRVYSGGADGTVRSWTPGAGPRPAPLAERPCPVVALHAADTPGGPALAVAWGDGLVELYGPDGRRAEFRPGPPVRAVALTADGADGEDCALVVGMDEALLCLAPRR